MAELAADFRHVVIVISEADMDGHFEAVGDGLSAIDSGHVLKVKIPVGGRVVMEIVAHEKHLFHGRVQRVDEIARMRQAIGGFEDAFGIEGIALGPL